MNSPSFRGFNERGELRIYHRNLPHWRQPGATYFVTFRQADSIPRTVLEAWDRLRTDWLAAHDLDPAWRQTQPERFHDLYQRIAEDERRAFEKEAARLLHHEIDQCHGSCLLRDPAHARLVYDALRHFHGERLWLGDVVVMPNHVHAILQPCAGHELEDLLESVKKFTARRILASVREQDEVKHGLWQAESYDRIIRDEAELAAYRRYIESNPAKAKLQEGEFLYHRCEWL